MFLNCFKSVESYRHREGVHIFYTWYSTERTFHRKPSNLGLADKSVCPSSAGVNLSQVVAHQLNLTPFLVIFVWVFFCLERLFMVGYRRIENLSDRRIYALFRSLSIANMACGRSTGNLWVETVRNPCKLVRVTPLRLNRYYHARFHSFQVLAFDIAM